MASLLISKNLVGKTGLLLGLLSECCLMATWTRSAYQVVNWSFSSVLKNELTATSRGWSSDVQLAGTYTSSKPLSLKTCVLFLKWTSRMLIQRFLNSSIGYCKVWTITGIWGLLAKIFEVFVAPPSSATCTDQLESIFHSFAFFTACKWHLVRPLVGKLVALSRSHKADPTELHF